MKQPASNVTAKSPEAQHRPQRSPESVGIKPSARGVILSAPCEPETGGWVIGGANLRENLGGSQVLGNPILINHGSSADWG